MANSKSAEKRIRISERNRRQNKYYKTSVRTLTKKFFKKLESYKTVDTSVTKEDLEKLRNLLYSLLDKGTKKRVFHKNTVARQKARLSSYLKSV